MNIMSIMNTMKIMNIINIMNILIIKNIMNIMNIMDIMNIMNTTAWMAGAVLALVSQDLRIPTFYMSAAVDRDNTALLRHLQPDKLHTCRQALPRRAGGNVGQIQGTTASSSCARQTLL